MHFELKKLKGAGTMKVAVVGSRRLWVENLGDYLPEGTEELISGGAQGIDACARSYAKQKGLAITEIFPCYARYSRAAPLRRNEEIVRRADMVLAFWDGESKGTAYTIRYAQKQGKPLTVHRLQPQEEHSRATD